VFDVAVPPLEPMLIVGMLNVTRAWAWAESANVVTPSAMVTNTHNEVRQFMCPPETRLSNPVSLSDSSSKRTTDAPESIAT
jgi:hypothetical protein